MRCIYFKITLKIINEKRSKTEKNKVRDLKIKILEKTY